MFPTLITKNVLSDTDHVARRCGLWRMQRAHPGESEILVRAFRWAAQQFEMQGAPDVANRQSGPKWMAPTLESPHLGKQACVVNCNGAVLTRPMCDAASRHPNRFRREKRGENTPGLCGSGGFDSGITVQLASFGSPGTQPLPKWPLGSSCPWPFFQGRSNLPPRISPSQRRLVTLEAPFVIMPTDFAEIGDSVWNVQSRQNHSMMQIGHRLDVDLTFRHVTRKIRSRVTWEMAYALKKTMSAFLTNTLRTFGRGGRLVDGLQK